MACGRIVGTFIDIDTVIILRRITTFTVATYNRARSHATFSMVATVPVIFETIIGNTVGPH